MWQLQRVLLPAGERRVVRTRSPIRIARNHVQWEIPKRTQPAYFIYTLGKCGPLVVICPVNMRATENRGPDWSYFRWTASAPSKPARQAERSGELHRAKPKFIPPVKGEALVRVGSVH